MQNCEIFAFVHGLTALKRDQVGDVNEVETINRMSFFFLRFLCKNDWISFNWLFIGLLLFYLFILFFGESFNEDETWLDVPVSIANFTSNNECFVKIHFKKYFPSKHLKNYCEKLRMIEN